MNKKNMLITGFYVNTYPRHKVLIKALKDCFIVKEKNYRGKGIFYFFKDIKKSIKNQDYIFIINSSYKFIFLFFYLSLFTNKTIIYDSFISFYDTFITDRKRFKKFSFSGIVAYFLDYLAIRMSDVLVFDTKEHKKYFVDKYNINKDKKKLLVWPVSLDLKEIDNHLYNSDIDNNINLYSKEKFNVLFYGTYIPLQGVDYIVEAANILKDQENIKFILLGDGQEKNKILNMIKVKNIKNIEVINSVSYNKLFRYIKKADLCLGIFGDTVKAKRVIPNKVLECLSANKIVITGKNNTLIEYFTDKKDIIYCNLADSEDLVKKIMHTYKNYQEITGMVGSARNVIEKYFSFEAIIQNIKKGLYK